MVVCDCSTPFEIASWPAGTVIAMSYVALSRGWSLLGNHHAADSGSPMARAPVRVVTQGVKPPTRRVEGVPSYVTVTVIELPLATACFGRTTSSPPWLPAGLVVSDCAN